LPFGAVPIVYIKKTPSLKGSSFFGGAGGYCPHVRRFIWLVFYRHSSLRNLRQSA
jgi:hypothetical protein